MRYTHLGRTGLRVSRICLGTMNFGPETDEPTSFAIMDSALDAGINFFDSANVYGRSKGRGATEEIVGRWFAQGGGRREKMVIATKLYGDMGEWPNEGRLSALNIRRACDASLKRLQTDYLDLYQMHHIDRHTRMGRDLGGHGGSAATRGRSSTWARPTSPAGTSPRRRRRPPGATSSASSVSSRSTTSVRSVEAEVLPAARGLRARGDPLVAPPGRAARGVVRKERDGSRRFAGRAAETIEARAPQLEAYEDLCAEVGEDPGTVGLAWLLTRPGGDRADRRSPDCPSTSARPLRAVDVTLDDKVLERLDELFPGHKTAPEDYAW